MIHFSSRLSFSSFVIPSFSGFVTRGGVARSHWVRAAILLAVCAMLSIPAFAQTPTASIVGTVLDPQGLPVEGANVTLTNQGTNYTYGTATSSTGAFQFASIDSGIYRVTVTVASFRAAIVEN